MSQISILTLLNGANYFTVSRSLAQKIGLNEAVLLSEIINKYEYYKERYQLETIDGEYGWFFLTIEDMESRTTLPRRLQDSAIENLIKHGFIKKQISGLPAKRYFFVNEIQLNIFFSTDESRDGQLSKINNANLYENAKLESPNSTDQFVQKRQTVLLYKKPESKRPDIKDDSATKISKKNSKRQTLDPKRRYRLDEEAQGKFDWLKQRISDTDGDTLCYWIKTYDFDKICKAYYEALSNKAKSTSAYMVSILKKKSTCVNACVSECIEFAEEFLKINKWQGVSISRKYFTYPVGSSYLEISLNQNPVAFAQQLTGAYKNLRGNF